MLWSERQKRGGKRGWVSGESGCRRPERAGEISYSFAAEPTPRNPPPPRPFPTNFLTLDGDQDPAKIVPKSHQKIIQ